jgi:hypothetical protein
LMAIVFDIPLRLGRGQNDRHFHWSGRSKQVKRERAAVEIAMMRRRVRRPIRRDLPPLPYGERVRLDFQEEVGPPPYLVTLTRITPKKFLDKHDNLTAAFKAVVDELSDWLGVNDGAEDMVRWEYKQDRGPWAVRVRIEACQCLTTPQPGPTGPTTAKRRGGKPRRSARALVPESKSGPAKGESRCREFREFRSTILSTPPSALVPAAATTRRRAPTGSAPLASQRPAATASTAAAARAAPTRGPTRPPA